MTNDGKLTAREIGALAWSLADTFGRSIGVQDDVDTDFTTAEFTNYLEEQARKVFDTASATNQFALISIEHDTAAAEKLKAGWRYGEYNPIEKTHPELLPYSQLQKPIQMKAQFFRTTVLSYMGLWSMF